MMTDEPQASDRQEEEEAAWSPVPDYQSGKAGAKLDWIQGLPFKYERGVELLPTETVKFYHDLQSDS